MTIAAHTLEEKIRSRTARTGVVGLGYVGLPLAVELAECGFETIGIDVDSEKVSEIRPAVLTSPTCLTRRSPHSARQDGFAQQRISRSSAELDTVNICVPTPLRKTKDPDMSYVVSAVEQIALLPASAKCLSSSSPLPTRVQPRNWSGRCWRRADSKAGSISSWPSPPSAWIPATPPSTHATCRRWSAGARPPARGSPRRCTKPPSTQSFRSAPRASPKWSSCWRTRSGR